MSTPPPTLSIDRVAEAQISSTVTTLLSASATVGRAKIPLNNVVAAGLSHQAAIMSKVARKVAEEMDPGEEKEAFVHLLDEHNTLVKNISAQDAIFTSQDHGTSLFAHNSQLITSLYTAPVAHVQNSITDSQSKSVPYFGALSTGPKLDLELEDFLSTAFRVAAQNNLSYSACSQMIVRKLNSTARLIVKSHCEENRVQESDLELTQLCHLLEQKFALFSSPRSASQALSSLPQVVANNYLSHVGQITRLTRLASRYIEDPAQKELLTTTRGLEAFKLCLSEADRTYLLNQERLRAQNNQQPLSLFKAAELLTTRAAETQQLMNVNRAHLATDEPVLEDNNAFYAGPQRGRPAPRQPEGQAQGRGGYRAYGADERRPYGGRQVPQFDNQHRREDRYNNRPQYEQYNQRQQYDRPSAPRGGQQGGRRGGDYPRRGRGGGGGRDMHPPQRSPAQQLQGPMKRPEITQEQAGAKPGQCLACLGPHSYLSPSCPYWGRSQLYPTPCRCGRGNHGYRACLNRRAPRGEPSRARGRRPGQGARRVEEEEEEDELADFFSSLSLEKN